MPSGASPRRVNAPSTCRMPGSPFESTTGARAGEASRLPSSDQRQASRSSFDTSVNSHPLSFWTGVGSD